VKHETVGEGYSIVIRGGGWAKYCSDEHGGALTGGAARRGCPPDI